MKIDDQCGMDHRFDLVRYAFKPCFLNVLLGVVFHFLFS